MFKALDGLRTALDGAKTYIVAAIVIAIGVAEGPLGFDIPGIDVHSDWLNYVLAGSGLSALRSTLAKIIIGLATR